MKIDVAITPESFSDKDLEGKIVVVVDVLRASTTITAALARGAEKVLPLATVDKVKKSAKEYPQGKVLLCGEREGIRIPGFDLGNSPHEYEDSIVQGKILLYTSTNGSRMLVKTKKARKVYVGSFVNMSAVVKRLVMDGIDCFIVCSGREGKFSLEDTVCAGMIVDRMRENSPKGFVQLTDEALVANIVYEHFSNDLNKMINQSFHGRYLVELGMKSDLSFSISLDLYDTVPVMENGGLIKSTP
mgnify:CR=1 FL=1